MNMKLKMAQAYAKNLRDTLKKNGVKLTFISRSFVTGSVYMEFDMPEMGKLRIGDHNERERYGYRWQLRLDQKEDSMVVKRKGHKQFFYSVDNLDGMVSHILNYRAAILRRREKVS